MDLYNLIISAKLSKGEGGDVSVGPLSVTQNGTYTAEEGHAYSPVSVNVPSVTPTGNINITSTAQTDVSAYATAQVVDADLVAGNIKKDVDILGVVGTYEGGSGSADLAALIDRSITSVVIPDGITAIGARVFSNCDALTSVTIPNTVTSIGDQAFYDCHSLVELELPESVTSIGNYFWYLSGSEYITLWSLTIRATTPPSLSSNSLQFGKGNLQHIYVPAESVDAYKAASGWSAKSSLISAIPT